jgi:hypothetical protein
MTNGISDYLIREAFFAKELPSEFNSKKLSEIYNIHDLAKSKLSKNIFNKESKLINFSIPKKGHFRRTAAVPHPLNFIRLANSINEGWNEIEEHYEKSNISISRIIFKDEKLVTEHSFDYKKDLRIKYLATNRYILVVDINTYYPSIYTHTIPWCLHTKEVAKVNFNNDSLLGNHLDMDIRNMQDGQTMGIAIGPLTSVVIQEIISTTIDNEFKKIMGRETPGFRYTDDIEYFFTTHEEASKALSGITKILKEYNLDINIEKNGIKKIPLEIEAEWVYHFVNYKFIKTPKSEFSIDIQRKQIVEYFNLKFNFQSNINEKGISKFAIKLFHSKNIVHRENWKIFNSLLMQAVQVDSAIMPDVFRIIENYKYKGYEIQLDLMELFVNSLIETNCLINNDYEIIWSLSLANKFDLKINENASYLLSYYENALVNILVIILYDKSLIHNSINFQPYEKIIVNNDLYDENWLFFYECCKNNWLNKSMEDLNDDRFFKQLYTNDLSFISPNISLGKVEVSQVICKRCIIEYTKDRNRGLDEIFNEFSREYGISIVDNHRIEIIDMCKEVICEKIEEIESREESTSTGTEKIDEPSPDLQTEERSHELANNQAMEKQINNDKLVEYVKKEIESKYHIHLSDDNHLNQWRKIFFNSDVEITSISSLPEIGNWS